MADKNIYNPETGDTGYQVPGAPIAAGWLSGTPGAPAVPTKAPTAVVSAGTATDHINSQIVPTMNQGKTDVANQAVKINTPPARPTTPAARTSPLTPEETIANTPDAGYQFIYNSSNGEKSQAVLGQPVPPGFTTTNVKSDAGAATAEDANGTVYKQFGDGTYGSFSPTDQYQGPATSAQFNGAKNATDIKNKMQQAIDGSYPLNANQLTQIKGITDSFAQLIQEQETANANLTGGVTGAENLYGMGNTLTGKGAIQGSIDDGIKKIAALSSKMASAVADMTSGFQKDNFTMLKSAYDTYNQAATERQAQVDKWQAQIDDAKKAAQVEQDKTDTSIKGIIEEATKNGASPQVIASLTKALDAHDYNQAIQGAAGFLQDPTSPAGQYSAYVTENKASGKPLMSAGDFLAAQKYKEAYSAASASVAAQSAYTASDKNQSKLEHQLQSAALSSRSNLGVQSKKVSAAIAAQVVLDQYPDGKGGYDVPAPAYGELLVSVANLLSPTGVASVTTQENLRQATLSGDLNGAITYALGRPMPGAPNEIIKNLATTIKNEGLNAELARNQELTAQIPTDLEQDRIDHVFNNLPSYEKKSLGDPAYQTPAQLNDSAVGKLADFAKTNQPMIDEIYAQFPNISPVDIAQKLGLMQSPQ